MQIKVMSWDHLEGLKETFLPWGNYYYSIHHKKELHRT